MSEKMSLSEIMKKYALIIVLGLEVLVFSIALPTFFTPTNLSNILLQNSYTVVIAIGIMMIMVGGGADLSVGYQISLVGITTTMVFMWAGLPVWLGVVVGIATGAALGFLNGILSVVLKVNTFVITLATMTLFQGLAYVITSSQSIYNFPASFKMIGQGLIGGWLPVCFIIMVVMVIFVSVFLKKTYMGRYVFAIGANVEASRLAGIKINKIKVLEFVIAGAVVAIGAIIFTSRTGTANAGAGASMTFDVFTCCVLGGVSLTGGQGRVWSVVVAVFILGLLSNGMQLMGMDAYMQYIVKGIVLLIAIWTDTRQQSQRQHSSREHLEEVKVNSESNQ